MLTTAWRVGGKVYAKRDQAYYAIAKQIVIVKYPAWLGDIYPWMGDVPISAEQQGWNPRLANLRARKQRELFGYEKGPPNEYGFDSEKWKKFVRRVARFMMWVDDRRGVYRCFADDNRQRYYEYCEFQSVKFADLALELRGKLT
jgi:hypothetical protein